MRDGATVSAAAILGPPPRLAASYAGNASERQAASATTVAVCLSGELREWMYEDPVTLWRLLERVVLPLDADLYVYMNAKNVSAAAAHVNHRFFARARLMALEIISQSGSTRGFNNATCADQRGFNHGFFQSIGMKRCGESAVPRGYTWIIRLRPDLSLPIRIPALPRRLPFGNDNGVVFAINAHCVPAGCSPMPGPTQCPPDGTCGALSDTFALIYGLQAQHAYFNGIHDDFVRCRRHRFHAQYHCEACAMGGRSGLSSPETKVGASLAVRGVSVRDYRFATRSSSDLHICRDAKACRLIDPDPVRVSMCPEALAAVPPGSWDLQAQRAYCRPLRSGLRARPAGWERLCTDTCGDALNISRSRMRERRR